MTDVEKRQDRSPVPADWTYAPGARVDRHRHARGALRPLHRRRVARRRREHFTTISPRDEAPLAEVGAGERGRRRTTPSPPRARRSRAGRSCPARERAKYLFRIARILAERSREFAVLETLNGGKPIKESRDVDLPLAAAHFFYYAGWADKLEYAFPNRSPKPLGVAGQIIPWNFPLLMLAWKIAPALAAGNTVVLKPAETTPLTALLFCDVLRQAELPPGVVNIVTGDGRDRRRARRRRGRQDRVHRLDRGRQGDPAPARRHRQEADARARRQGGEHRLRRRRARPGGRRHRQRHLLQPGPRLLRGLAPVRAGVDLRAGDRQAEAAHGRRCASATRSTRTPTSARSTRGCSSSKIEELVAAGEAEGAEIYQPPCRLPEKGYWFVADRLHERRAELPHRAGGDLRPGAVACSPSARPTRRSRRRTTRRTASAPASGRRRARASSGWRERLRAGVVWANTFNRFDPTSPFGGYKESGFGREGGLHGLEPYLDFDMSDARLPVKKTYKLYIGGAFPRSESGRTYEAQGQNVARASRKDVRDAVVGRARRAAEVGVRDRVQPRPGALPHRRDDGGARCPSSPQLCSRQGRGRALDRSLGLVRGLRRQARAGARLVEPGRRPVLQLHDPGADRRRRGRRARRPAAARPRLAARAGAHRRQRRRRARLRDAAARRDRARRGARDERRPGRRRQPPHRASGPSSRRGSRATWT